jgi:diaminohydroxyphosphoribosylaminopyrimidine deaminase/5-amino-6-(5-phosphoribosylamino)uracil reductase
VTYGLEDPNPIVNGQGAAILRAAGIKTSIFSQYQDELEELCEVFLHNMRTQKPFVSVKVASSLDGIMVLKSGESKWITGESAREYSHFLRASHDGLLVGRNTIEQDDPSLNIRHPKFMDKENKVIILDPHAQLLEKLSEYSVTRSHKPENIFVVVRSDLPNKPASSPYNIVTVDYKKVEGFDFSQMLTQLWSSGIKSILVEGGAMTLSSFIKENLAQRLYLFQAPILLGHGFGRSWSENVTLHEMSDRIHIKNRQIFEFGGDILITGRF